MKQEEGGGGSKKWTYSKVIFMKPYVNLDTRTTGGVSFYVSLTVFSRQSYYGFPRIFSSPIFAVKMFNETVFMVRFEFPVKNTCDFI